MQQLLHRILDSESAVNGIIQDYETGGLALIEKFAESNAEDARRHTARRLELQKRLKAGLEGLLSQTNLKSKAARELKRQNHSLEKMGVSVHEEQMQRVEKMMDVWG